MYVKLNLATKQEVILFFRQLLGDIKKMVPFSQENRKYLTSLILTLML